MHSSKVLGIALGVLLLTACTPSISSYRTANYAVIMVYDSQSYNINHPETRIVKLVSIDGKPVTEGTSPIRILPGLHHLVAHCVDVHPGVWVKSSSVLSLHLKRDQVYELYPIAINRPSGPICKVKVRVFSKSVK